MVGVHVSTFIRILLDPFSVVRRQLICEGAGDLDILVLPEVFAAVNNFAETYLTRQNKWRKGDPFI